MGSQKTPSLIFEVDDREMLQKEYSLLKIKITNIGEVEARDINIKLHSEVDKKLSKEATPYDYPKLKELKPYESKEITFVFHPIIAGKVPLMIISSCKSSDGGTFPEKKETIFVNIHPQVSKPEAIVNIGEIVKDSTAITDSVIQKSNIGEKLEDLESKELEIKKRELARAKEEISLLKNEIERREIEHDRLEAEQGINLLEKLKEAKRQETTEEKSVQIKDSILQHSNIGSYGDMIIKESEQSEINKDIKKKQCGFCKEIFPSDYNFCPKCGRDFQRRKENIRYFCKILYCFPMCLRREFKLSVYISQLKEEIDKIKKSKKNETNLEEPFNFKLNQEKFLILKLISAACYISPDEQKINLYGKINSVDFKIAPRITGPFVIDIEIYYEDEKIKDIPIQIQIQEKPIEMPLDGITTIKMTEKQVVYFSIIGTTVTILSANLTTSGLALLAIILSLSYILWKRKPTEKLQSDSVIFP